MSDHKSWLMVEVTRAGSYERQTFQVADGTGVGQLKRRMLETLDECLKRPGCAGFSVSVHTHDCDHEST